MLVLSRLEGESIIIGNDIIVTVMAIRGTKIRLGITAPGDVMVDRLETRDSKNHSLGLPPAPRPNLRGRLAE